MKDSQLMAVAAEALVAREEVGEEGIAERVGGEDMVEEGLMEIMVAGAVSGSVGCWLIQGLIYNPDQHTVAGEMDVERVRKMLGARHPWC
jgi:hypothetical protein